MSKKKQKSRTWRVHDSHLNIYLQKQIQKTRFYNLKLLYVLEVGVIYFLLLIRVHTHTNTDEKSIKKSKDLCLFFVFYFERKFINTVRLLILTTLPLCVQSKWWLLFKKTQKRSKTIYTNEFLETHTHSWVRYKICYSKKLKTKQKYDDKNKWMIIKFLKYKLVRKSEWHGVIHLKFVMSNFCVCTSTILVWIWKYLLYSHVTIEVVLDDLNVKFLHILKVIGSIGWILWMWLNCPENHVFSWSLILLGVQMHNLRLIVSLSSEFLNNF